MATYMGRGEGNQGVGRSMQPPTAVVSLSWCRLGLSCHPDATPASPREGSQTPPHLQKRAERLSFALWATVSALHFPTAPSRSPVSSAAFSCLCTWEAWRMGEHRSFSPGCHASVAGMNDQVSAQCKHNWALFISGGKRSWSSGSVPRREEVKVEAVSTPSPLFSDMFKLPRRRFASRFTFLHPDSYQHFLIKQLLVGEEAASPGTANSIAAPTTLAARLSGTYERAGTRGTVWEPRGASPMAVIVSSPQPGCHLRSANCL